MLSSKTSLKGKEKEDHQDEHSPTHPEPDSGSIAHCPNQNRNAFPRFGEFPVEIKHHIFKQNLPASHILDFNFDVNSTQRIKGWYTFVQGCISAFPGLLSLLETCKISNDTVYRAGFKKVELILPGVHDSSVQRTEVKGLYGTTNYYRFLLETDTLNYSYMRPSVDVLLVSACPFAKLHKIGGSIGLLSSLSHLAIDGFKDIFEDDAAEASELFAMLFEIIGKNCQALEKVNMVIGHGSPGFWISKREATTNRRLLPMDDDLLSYHLVEDPNLTRSYYLLEAPENLRAICIENARLLMEELRNHVETKKSEEPDVVEYWGKVKVVPTLMSWLEEEDGPRLWVPALRALIACHKDGTPLDRYRGMAQIFDGAEW